MGLERDGIKERIVCDGCGRRTNWYDNRRINASQAMDVNNISRLVDKGSPVYVCEPCQMKGQAASALAAMVVMGPQNVDVGDLMKMLQERSGPGPDEVEPDDIPIDERRGAVMRGEKPLAGQKVHVSPDMPGDVRDAIEKTAEAAGAELTEDPEEADEELDGPDDLWGSIGDAMTKAIREEGGEVEEPEPPLQSEVETLPPDDEGRADTAELARSDVADMNLVYFSHDWVGADGESVCTQCGLGDHQEGAKEFCAANPERLLEEDEPDPDEVRQQLDDADDVFGKFDDML